MRLTIENLNKIIGQKIDTTTAQWEVVECEERRNDYRIQIKLNYAYKSNLRLPKQVQFTLLRYNEYQTVANEWKMLNNWKTLHHIVLTKGLLEFKTFVGILGGQLEYN